MAVRILEQDIILAVLIRVVQVVNPDDAAGLFSTRS